MKNTPTIYLCQTDEGYVHAVFTTELLARAFCRMHPAYHIVIRELWDARYDL